MTAYFIDATFGFLTWVILILLVWGIIKLIKREKLKTINFITVLLISLLGLISPTFDLLSGKYQTKPMVEISEQDKVSFKNIIQNCLSGQLISKETHSKFYSLADKYNMSPKDINEMFSVFYNKDLIFLQKSFYDDALKTIQTRKISKSKIRLELEDKLLNDPQKERNKEYLKKILANEPIHINGELTVLDEDYCNAIIDNIDEIFIIGKQNIDLLKNRKAFN